VFEPVDVMFTNIPCQKVKIIVFFLYIDYDAIDTYILCSS